MCSFLLWLLDVFFWSTVFFFFLFGLWHYLRD